MAKRLLELEPTSLFGSEAILTTLTGVEELSSSFEFTLTISSPNEKIKPEDVIGKPLAVCINRGEKDPRYIHGYINAFSAGNTVASTTGLKVFRNYRVKIVSWLWFMTRASRCFVYLPDKAEKSIQDVLDEVIKRVKSYNHVDPKIESSNAKILSKHKVEHCVQYRETDFTFLSRTLERYGVFYYLKYEKDKHTVVLSDQSNYPNAADAEVIYSHSIDERPGENVITSWEHEYEFVPGKWEHTDYDFLNPSTELKASAQKHSSISIKTNDGYEIYEYPGDYVKKDDGDALAALRLEAEEAHFNRVSGTSNCKSFSPGYCFKLTDHLNCKDEKGKAYLITSVHHSASQPGPHSSAIEEASYSNSFTCIPKDCQYRPTRKTPQPILASVQTAEVVGPAGEEIFTDAHGRVKLQFHWDREGKKDENTSCWVRVSQVHAGRGFGGIDIPRIGDEVVVSFLEGDLDRPLVTGRVYHEEAKPPFALPGSKTVSGFKTKTYKGKGYNEFSMDDSTGKEKITIHAQFDMATTVEHDDTQTIHNNRVITVDGTHTETIDKDTSITVKSGNYFHEVKTGTALIQVKGAVTEKFGDSMDTTVKNGIAITSETAHIYIHTATSIQLHVGDSNIWMDKSGQISIRGNNIAIEGKQSVSIKGGIVHSYADSQHETKGAIVLSEGSATNTVKGGMVMLNP